MQVLKALSLMSVAATLIASPLCQAADFIDPAAENWLKSKPTANELAQPFKNVIVYLRPAPYVNRSQANRELALIEEESFSRSYLSGQAQNLLSALHIKPSAYLWSSNALVVSVDRSLLRLLSKISQIEAIVLDRELKYEAPLSAKDVSIKMDESKFTYGLQILNVPTAWDQGYTGKGVVVGVIDTGVDAQHPILKDKILLQKDFTEDNDNIDHHGHGTHVCGTIVGGGHDGKAIGVAPDAKIVMAKVFSAKGSTSLSILLRGMEWMLDPDGDPSTADGPRVVSNSWGGSSQFSYGFKNIVKTWRRFDVFPNFAAGNSGYFLSISAPGSYPFSFAVGALDENKKITSFSSKGPTIWWNKYTPKFVKKPDVAAPGLAVYSSVPDGKFARYSGTSMATPHVAGVIALALSANPHLKVEQIIQILTETAADQGKKGLDNRYGAGLIQADLVVQKAKTMQVGSAFVDQNPAQWQWDQP